MTVAPAGPGFSTTTEALRLRDWQLGPGQPTLVTGQFSADDFHLIVDDRADVHVSSKDGRAASFAASVPHDLVAVFAASLSSIAPVLRRVLPEATRERLLRAPAI
ncbi:hypothetical protein [Streptomyces sp. LN785]|uniref:hypothetical protein n=1 Tax=Streptomyces sp. LN785 TaxID=3112983 RepID=UPI0037144000